MLRLLATLLPAHDPADSANPDNPDLGLARSLLDLWLGLDPLADPLAELRPPGSPTVTGATPVHAVVGSLTARDGQAGADRGVRGVAVRAGENPDTGAAARPDPSPGRAASAAAARDVPRRAGLFAHPGPRPGRRRGHARRCARGGRRARRSRGPSSGSRSARRPAGWSVALIPVAHPGSTGRWPCGGSPPRSGCRSASQLAPAPPPLGSDLHDVSAFGVRTPVLTVAGGAGCPGHGASHRAARGARPARGSGHPARRRRRHRSGAGRRPGRAGRACAAVHRRGERRRVVPRHRLGHRPGHPSAAVADPAGVAAAVLADAARTTTLAAALRTLTGDARDPANAGSTVALTFGGDPVSITALLDLATRSMSVRAAGSTGVGWAADVALGPASTGVVGSPMTATLRIGADLPDPGSGAPGRSGQRAGAGPARYGVRESRGSGCRQDSGGAGRAGPGHRGLARARPGRGRRSARGCRPAAASAHPARRPPDPADSDAAPTAAGAVDAVLDALGILAPQPPPPLGADPADPLPRRGVRLPAGLFADPGAWLRGVEPGPAALATALPALVDAVRGLLDAGSTPGRRSTSRPASASRW